MLETTESNVFSTLALYAVPLTLLLALILDHLFGEAKKYHYLVGFGHLANWLESRINHNHQDTDISAFSASNAGKGFIAWAILVLPLPALYLFILSFITELPWYWLMLLDALILHLALGKNSLQRHALQVYQPLQRHDLTTARKFTGYLVSRETSTLTPQQMSRATVESVLENGHDAVIASLFYYLIGGAPLVILHRLANTLDAMWGYKKPKFYSFGYASARLDDALGFISAKCCTLLYAVQGIPQRKSIMSLINAIRQGSKYKSHNGGWVMAAGATVMQRTIGGQAEYHGTKVESVTMGCGKYVDVEDIPSSLSLVSRACAILLFLTFISHALFFNL